MAKDRDEPRGGSSLPPVLPDLPDQNQAEEEEEISNFERHRRTLRNVEIASSLVFVLFLLLGTAVVWYVNRQVLERPRKQAASFTLLVRSALQGEDALHADLTWSELPGGDTPERRPRVLVDGKPLPAEIRVAGSSREGMRVPVAFEAPANAAAGTYRGEVVLTAGSASQSFPVTFQVPSRLDEWSVLAWWLVLVVTVLVIGHVYSLVVHPGPRGSVTVQTSAARRAPPTRKALGSGLFGLLFPITRSRVTLAKLVSDLKSPGLSAAGLAGMSLEFTRYGYTRMVRAYLVIEEGADQVRRVRAAAPPASPKPEDGSRIFGVEALHDPSVWFVVWEEFSASGPRAWMAFQYRTKE